MWFPFRRKKKADLPAGRQGPDQTPKSAVKKVIVGFIIGGAISSIVGAKIMQQRGKTKLEDESEDERDED